MLQVDSDISSCGHTPESTSQLKIVNPDLYILSVQELIQSTRMVEV